VILVTLGTHPSPMDRLVAALDDLAERGAIGEEVIIQSASIGLRPRHAIVHGVVPFDQLAQWTHQARAVVTHGGPGSIMQALSSGHRPVVVPRDPRLGEHVDDHQQRFARWLASRRPILVIESMDDLGAAITDAIAARTAVDPGSHHPEQAIAHLRSIIEAGR